MVPCPRRWVELTTRTSDDFLEITMICQLANAKSKLRKEMTRALEALRQPIRRRGQVGVVPAEADDHRQAGARQTFTDYLLNGPDLSGLDLMRDRSPMREVALS